MLDLIAYTGIVVLFVLGIAPVVVDMLREYRDLARLRQRAGSIDTGK